MDMASQKLNGRTHARTLRWLYRPTSVRCYALHWTDN